MFIFIRYGKYQRLLGIHEPFESQCPNCREIGSISFAIQAEYFHIWYIPFFPVEKDGFARCSNCPHKVDSLKFNRTTRDDFKEIKKQFRYPLYMYTGLLIVFGPILLAILLELLGVNL
ncbi:MAG: zinc-ribbon domain-containing protein [Chitinophagaceae bacterium]|nr:zinc-ribbon domain-containing protein [Chitinophagaceae bacterium]